MSEGGMLPKKTAVEIQHIYERLNDWESYP